MPCAGPRSTRRTECRATTARKSRRRPQGGSGGIQPRPRAVPLRFAQRRPSAKARARRWRLPDTGPHNSPPEGAHAPPGGFGEEDTRAREEKDSRSRDAETRREQRYCTTISPQARSALSLTRWTEMEAAPSVGLTCGGATTLKLALPEALAVNVMSTALVPEPHVVLPV